MVYKSKFALVHNDEVVMFNNHGDFKYSPDYENVVLYIKDRALLFEGYKYKKQKLTDKKYYVDSPTDMIELDKFLYLDFYFVLKKEFFSNREYYKARSSWVGDFAEVQATTLIRKYLPNFQLTYIGESIDTLEKH